MAPDVGAKLIPGTVPGINLAPTSGAISRPRNENEMLPPTVKIEVQNINIGRVCQVCAFRPCTRLRIDVFKN